IHIVKVTKESNPASPENPGKCGNMDGVRTMHLDVQKHLSLPLDHRTESRIAVKSIFEFSSHFSNFDQNISRNCASCSLNVPCTNFHKFFECPVVSAPYWLQFIGYTNEKFNIQLKESSLSVYIMFFETLNLGKPSKEEWLIPMLLKF
ncbi:hypothetical protein ROZALSC1DRAFT_25617, partial [Rozella allomycis CSF55]